MAAASQYGFLISCESRISLHNSGPYKLADDREMIVRDFMDLSESDFPWLDGVAADVPYNNLTVTMAVKDCHFYLVDVRRAVRARRASCQARIHRRRTCLAFAAGRRPRRGRDRRRQRDQEQMSDIRPSDIEALLEIFEASSWSEMKVKIEGLELFVSKTAGARPSSAFSELATSATPAPAAPPIAAAPRAGAAPENWVAVRAPNLGTFYRAPKPGAAPYVKVGQHVDPTTELCLIEVMKLFTTVFAGVSGVVRQVSG